MYFFPDTPNRLGVFLLLPLLSVVLLLFQPTVSATEPPPRAPTYFGVTVEFPKPGAGENASESGYPYPERIIMPPRRCAAHADCGGGGKDTTSRAASFCGWPLERTYTDFEGREAMLRRSIKPDHATGLILQGRCLPCATCVEPDRRTYTTLGQPLAPVDGRCPVCPTSPPAPSVGGGNGSAQETNTTVQVAKNVTAGEHLRRFRKAISRYGRASTSLRFSWDPAWFVGKLRAARTNVASGMVPNRMAWRRHFLGPDDSSEDKD